MLYVVFQWLRERVSRTQTVPPAAAGAPPVSVPGE
jgi:hypothetical protein